MSVLKEILERVNDFDSETHNLKNKIIEVEQSFKTITESLMLNKYDYNNALTLENNVEAV